MTDMMTDDTLFQSDCVEYYHRQWYLLPADTPPPTEIDDFDNFQDRWDAICEVIEVSL